MSKVFLSHNHADKPFARRLAADLRQAGHSVWIDEAEILLGDSLIEKIRQGLDEVDYVAAILSTASIDSPWVQRELDIASNREISENRVVVLPLVKEKVNLPGFLQGKLYADFTDESRYSDSFKVLLTRLGATEQAAPPSTDEIRRLRTELAEMKALAVEAQQSAQAHSKVALKGKSPKLRAAIESANSRHPGHAPINNTYAFEIGQMVVTLDYLFWAVAKSQREGAHVLEALLTVKNQWGDVERMLEAYDDMLAALEVEKP
ncbi:toll/interleukin-1 receptor domain-containing protein [Pandoraea apista]|uniref:toll/interleukin-1 receptor domain-containing protein n=1 Tax=Pandoraea apista TaxID=93218 RepID=UPI00058A9276|nr:toll/interleukin-1 receptor domain-containing protein [Pandoraea apista]AJF00995.1 molecular chaperone Tir [Pandoraea apista]AKH75215.1 molecular chaperone Tir [Pandoraea apista]AKI64534.1 molecular chaperone Tir [Pandoraea apista]